MFDTGRLARGLFGAAAAAAYLWLHGRLGGVRPAHLALAGAGLGLASLPGARGREIARFLLPLVLIAAAYDAHRHWLAWRGPIHVAEPLHAELALFGIETPEGVVTPAAWWQARTRPWLDLPTGAAYLAYLPVFVGAAAWWRWGLPRRAGTAEEAAALARRAEAVMLSALLLNVAGYAIYVLYPAAPPWYVDLHGVGPALLDVAPDPAGGARFDAATGLPLQALFYGGSANVFGAIPSLHVGQVVLLAWFAARFRSLRSWLWPYAALVAFASVYLNHHYIVDGLAGAALAILAAAAAELAAQTLNLYSLPGLRSKSGGKAARLSAK